MDRSQREEFESIAGELLAELGYTIGDGPGTEPREFEEPSGDAS